MSHKEKYLGYLKYSGKSVEDGFLDTRKSAEALLGFDEVLRYFLLKEAPSLKEIDFEIPVRIQKGSWEALIPEIIDKIFTLQNIVGVYAVCTVKKAATDGLLETGALKDIKATFRIAIQSAQWMIKIASHIGTLTKKDFDNPKFRNNDIGIPNEKKEYLYVPKKYFDLFADCPSRLFSKNAGVVEKERVLEIGIFEENVIEKVFITDKEKSIFYSMDEDVLFPELKHGQHVELKGNITRGNEKTNTIGFEYQEHILTCKPQNGNIITFKDKIVSQEDNHLFPSVIIIGMIDRTDKNGEFKEKKPQIIFSDIITMKTEDNTLSLFDNKNHT